MEVLDKEWLPIVGIEIAKRVPDIRRRTSLVPADAD
jgi:hypothetical protein